MNVLNVNSKLDPLTHLQSFHYQYQPTYLDNLVSVQSTCGSRSSSAVTLARPSESSSLKITNHSFTYASPYLWNQLHAFFIPSISFCSLSSWYILRILPYHSHHMHLCSHHLSLPRPFTPDLELIYIVILIPSGLPPRILNLY